MGSLVDGLRKTVNEFLSGGNAEAQVERAFEQEMDTALEEVRPEIQEICKTSIRTALDSISTKGVMLNEELITRLMNDEVEQMFSIYDNEIEASLAESLLAELKNVKILPKDS